MKRRHVKMMASGSMARGRRRGAILLCILAGSVAGPAKANDSSSVLGAGGLVLTKNDAISIQREDLSIAPTEIKVHYEMRNDRAGPVTLRVAFPMPDLPIETPDGGSLYDDSGRMTGHGIDLPAYRPNFMNFRVSADGNYVRPETEVQAILPDGRNIVDALREIGGGWLVLHPMMYFIGPWPDAAYDPDSDIGLTNLRKLRALGAIDGDGSGAMPLWRTRITFHWMQTFKPGITVIEHRYVPVAGSYPIDRDGDSLRVGGLTPDEPHLLNQSFCLDSAAKQALQSAPYESGNVHAFTLRYILTTGANWAGPIGIFHLTVDGLAAPWPGLPVRVVSLCAELPLQRTSLTRLEGTVQNYVPKSELNVLMIPDWRRP